MKHLRNSAGLDRVYLVAPVGVGPQVGGIVLFLNGHKIISWRYNKKYTGK